MPAAEPTHPHGHLVWRLSMRWRVAVDRALLPLNLTHAQYVVLASLSAFGAENAEPPSQRVLAEHSGLEPLYLSKLVRTLEGSGLVSRRPDPADSRANLLRLSLAGEELTAEAVEVVRQLIGDLLEPLGGPDSARARQFQHDLTTLLSGKPAQKP